MTRSGPDLEDELELGHATVPPPWQRVNNDAVYLHQPGPAPAASGVGGSVEEPTVETSAEYRSSEVLPRPPLASVPVPPTAAERPVVTGTAAARLYGDAAPHAGGYSAGPPRTTVHLENASATTGTMRPATAATPSALRRPGRGPRRANLQIKRFDPWSVLKLSLVLGVALFFVWLVAVGALYAVLDGMGVWDKVNGISTDLLQGNETNSEPLISAGRVFGIAAIVGAINIVLFSALATVGAFVYNVSADLAGGLEVTLAERE
ncbi:DUF3566 domain-containing protein [Actinophytocola sp.]|uniref:DUF3566 domain-containing protein n=1 Tax=Actinophytocola sp. TaxID=1872138 RepID=UPI0039C8BC14